MPVAPVGLAEVAGMPSQVSAIFLKHFLCVLRDSAFQNPQTKSSNRWSIKLARVVQASCFKNVA